MLKGTVLDFVVEQLDNFKIENIEVIAIGKKTSIAEQLVVGTGRSEKHIESTMEQLRLLLKENSIRARTLDGRSSGWIVLDLDDILVNLFTEECRNKYKLEQLWTKEIK
ncbi:MAG: ribosome silencing factor [Rickettsiales bacterium]|jgi:ribosome-associated protein|nr:ribosome silencing factor [Rickettsiales bacterium]